MLGLRCLLVFAVGIAGAAAYNSRVQTAMERSCNIDGSNSRARHPQGEQVQMDCSNYRRPNAATCNDVCRGNSPSSFPASHQYGCYNSWNLLVDDKYRSNRYRSVKSAIKTTPRSCREKICRPTYVFQKSPRRRLAVDMEKWCCCKPPPPGPCSSGCCTFDATGITDWVSGTVPSVPAGVPSGQYPVGEIGHTNCGSGGTCTKSNDKPDVLEDKQIRFACGCTGGTCAVWAEGYTVQKGSPPPNCADCTSANCGSCA